MNQRPMSKLERKARSRVVLTDALYEHRDVIFYDWPNWEEHLEWVLHAPVPEILDWIEDIKRECARETFNREYLSADEEV